MKFIPYNMPRMIEVIEQQALIIETQNLKLEPNDLVIEFLTKSTHPKQKQINERCNSMTVRAYSHQNDINYVTIM